MGKTQLAIEYAHRFGDHYRAVLWANAESASSLTADCVTLASLLDLPEKAEQDQQRVVEVVKRCWQHTPIGC